MKFSDKNGPKAHFYRRAFFPKNSKFGNNWRYVSIYGGVLPLFVKFSRPKNIKFVNIPIFGKKKSGKYGRLKNCAKKLSKFWKKKLSDKNDAKKPTRSTIEVAHFRHYFVSEKRGSLTPIFILISIFKKNVYFGHGIIRRDAVRFIC